MDDQGHDSPTLVESSNVPKLEIIRGENVGQAFKIKPTTSIGRERDNDIILLDLKTSRYHAQISLEADQWTLTDLGSSNHTYVNGHIVTAPVALRSGDRIGVGETELMFRAPGQPAVETSPVRTAPTARSRHGRPDPAAAFPTRTIACRD